jgi:predicted transcriptional regulator
MDLPIEVIEAVKQPTAEPKATPVAKKPRKKKVIRNKKITERILNAMGRGLRTATAIANDLNANKHAVQNTLWNMKSRGTILGTKKDGKEQKYFLLSEGSSVGATPKKVAVKPKSVYNKAGVNTTNSFNTPPKENINRVSEMQKDIDRLIQRISNLEVTLTEKEKEVWSLECEVFDKKAIIKYLEEKLFQLGVRV